MTHPTKQFADLHIHTYYSDSTSSPEEVLTQAQECGLSCIAITDHDTIDGVEPTVKASERFGIEVIPGIELSTELNGRDIHMLGYFTDYHNPQLHERLDVIQEGRIERAKEMIQKLSELGIKGIDFEEVASQTRSKSVGRPHLANLLIRDGHVKSFQEAFDKYLGEGAVAYVGKNKMTPYDAIEFVRSVGGVSVLAHPMMTHVDELIPGFVMAGMGGLEVHYHNVSEHVTRFYTGIARKHKLLVTGGSDAHGDVKQHTCVGKVRLPYEYVVSLKNMMASV